ncbi:MAG: GNAT family N-acetyltransferase [Bryobacteraceae bacterium]|nr:GNAT family N-acetyltransferase [Bryobacteraceae bacterium]
MREALRLVPGASSAWDRAVSGVGHDFHHTAAHHRLWEEPGVADSWLAIYGGEDRLVAWPYLLRRIESSRRVLGEEAWDITCVDGYAGPLLRGCPPGDPFVARAIEAMFAHWQTSGVVSVFTRFHPLFANHLVIDPGEGCAGSGEPRDSSTSLRGLRHEGHTVSIDLALDTEAAYKQYRPSHLYQIRKSRRLGIVAKPDDSPEAFREFVRLYHRTMVRNGARAHYFFPEAFLARLRTALGGGASIHTATLNGKTIGAVFITEYAGVVQYLLGGTEDGTKKWSPLKLLLESVREWARERGNHTMHLGGGRECRDEDSLFYFKCGFSAQRHCFYTGRWVLDRVKYDKLAADHLAGVAGTDAGAPTGCYFPAYRTPLSEAPAVSSRRPAEERRAIEEPAHV